jgi:threonine aldolase
MTKFQFASDNTSGIFPEAWQALDKANNGYVRPYGDDEYTAAASELFRKTFETDCDVYFVFNGTAANSLALASLCQSYHSVIAHETGHVETDECGGPEFFSNGTKLLLAPGPNGKFDLDAVEHLITKRSDIHYPRPRVITLTQPTELGTVYTLTEIRAICALARRYGMKVHVDGARFAHAMAALKLPPKAITWEAGVDVQSFGGTKCGGTSEAVVFFDRTLSPEFAYRCKQAGQLASKMRFLAAPWLPFLDDGLWLRYAEQANCCARALRERLAEFSCLEFLYPTEANAVFLRMPQAVQAELQARRWVFYVFIGGGARLMCSWKTTMTDIDEFVADVRDIAGG